MAQILKICLFCLNETNDAISTFDRTTHAENARAIINKHFWFDVRSYFGLNLIINSNGISLNIYRLKKLVRRTVMFV